MSLMAQGENPVPERRQIDPERKKELLEKIERLKHNRLRETLGLDEAAAKQFFEKYQPAEKEIQDLVKERNEQVRKLRGLTQGELTDGDVDPTLESIRSINRRIEDRMVNLDKDLKPILTPRQRARLLVFEQEFNRKLREHGARPRPDGPPPVKDQIKERLLEKRRLEKQEKDERGKHEDEIKKKGRKR
jgi:hypothetical protein